MGLPTVGDVVVISFPFADQKTYKKRPAVVVAIGSLDTVILCQITSHPLPQVPKIKLDPTSFKSGQLPIISFVRPDKLATVDTELAQHCIAKLADKTISDIHGAIRSIFDR